MNVRTPANSMVLAVLLLGACTQATVPVSRPPDAASPAPSASGTASSSAAASPASGPGTPLVLPSRTSIPQSVPVAPGTARRDIDLTAGVTPNRSLTLGSRVTVTVNLHNRGAAVDGLSLQLFLILPPGVAWTIERSPEGTHVSEDCSEEPPGYQAGPTCIPFEMTAPGPAGLRAGVRWTETIALRIAEFRCPGKGDFIGEFHVGSSPGINDPTAFRIVAGFENEQADYASASSPRPVPASRCTPESIQ